MTTTKDASISTAQEPAAETPKAENLSVAQLTQMFTAKPQDKTTGAGTSTVSTSVEASPDPATEPDHEHGQDDQPPEVTPSPQPETAEGDTDESSEAAASEPASDPRQVREFETPKFYARVNELTAKIKALEQQLAEHQATDPAPKPNGEAPAKPEARGDGTIPMVFEDAKLTEYDRAITAARQMIEVADSNPNGLEIPGENGAEARTFTPEQLARMKQRALNDLTQMTVRRELREEQLRQARQADTLRQVELAATKHPWIKDPNSRQYQEAMRLIFANPRLQLEPNAVFLVAGAVEAAMTAVPGKPKAPAPKPTNVTTRPAGVPVKPSGGRSSELQAKLVAAEARVEQTGSMDSYKEVLRLRRELELERRR